MSVTEPRGQGRHRVAPRLLVRTAVACLIAGFGLLTVAEAGWAHAIGLVCLFGFVVTAFCAIVLPAMTDETAQPKRRSDSLTA
jgi:cytochrome d ubiquinol oxidase subunit II